MFPPFTLLTDSLGNVYLQQGGRTVSISLANLPQLIVDLQNVWTEHSTPPPEGKH